MGSYVFHCYKDSHSEAQSLNIRVGLGFHFLTPELDWNFKILRSWVTPQTISGLLGEGDQIFLPLVKMYLSAGIFTV